MKTAEPKVYLVAAMEPQGDLRCFVNDHGIGEWTDTCGATEFGDLFPEIAGRLCYMSYANPRPGGNAAYLDHIKEVGHGSVLEHSVFSFIITGVSRSLTHELIRHRAGMSFSQLSQRFVDESEAAFVPPPLLKQIVEETNDPDLAAKWAETMQGLQDAYAFFANRFEATLAHIPDKTARRKMAREAARSVLPNATETKIYVTANARAWRHFLEMRGDGAADAEIRRLALLLLPVLKGAAPNLFGDYEVKRDDLGRECITTKYRKV
jgi:thymidylate synthase (FAD)